MAEGVRVLKGVNIHITYIFLNADPEKTGEPGTTEDENQEHRKIKDYLKG
jgi:hypothetical protein